MMSLFFVNTSHAGQKHLIVLTFGETDDFPRAQKSAFGGDFESLLPLHVGQAPQYFLHICRFSTVSTTVFVVSGIFMVLFTQEVLVRRENNTFTPKLTDIHSAFSILFGWFFGEGRLKRSHFDRAVMITVPGEIPNREAALREIFEALKARRYPACRRNHKGSPFPDPQHGHPTGGPAGFTVKEFSGTRFSFSLTLEKPPGI